MLWHAPAIWEGGECWIIGGGPSMPQQFGVPEDVIRAVTSGASTPRAYSEYLTPLHSRHVIGINNAYMMGNWIQVEFFGDNSWYLFHRRALAQFPGMKVSCAPRFAKDGNEEGVKYLAKDRKHRRGITSDTSKVGWNNNSGAAAISLARHFGVVRIYLLGFDMRRMEGHGHWHAPHNEKDALPFGRHLKGFPFIGSDARKMGIEILNVSPDSAIKSFKKVKLLEVLR